MSCLSVEITLLPHLLPNEVAISRTSFPPIIRITRRNSIDISVNRVAKGLELSVSDIFWHSHPKVSCGIVCSIADIYYLNVSPEDVQWITSSDGIIYIVESNTEWEVLNS